jgi:hypothetical protein
MVAMVAGLFVSMAVFTLARFSSGFAMRQSRMSDATLQAVLGFERLKADITRAGFLGTPNFTNDPAFCGKPQAPNIPTGIAQMTAIRIEDIPIPQRSTEMTLNGIVPQRLILGGSYSSADHFEIDHIDDTNPVTIYLTPDSLAMANIGYHLSPTLATLDQVFKVKRAVRIVDKSGRTHFGEIAGVTDGAAPQITLAAFPEVQFQRNSPFRCGIQGTGKGALLSVVNLIRYDIDDLSGDANFDGMFGGGPTYEVGRRELIREELDVDHTPMEGTRELVAEYAVDLGFSLLVEKDSVSRLTRVSGADVALWAGDPTALPAGNGPQLIRAVHTWLSVRSREADRLSALSLAPTAPGPHLMRISLHPTDGNEGPFARVRTLQSTVPLNNQKKSQWSN